MKKIFSIILIMLTASMYGQNIRLSRGTQILILHNIDSLVKNYEFFSTLSEGIKITENQKENFLSLFRDSSVIVFDDISANYAVNNKTVINEKRKTVADYIRDISSDYQNVYCRITQTDAGTVYKRLMPERNGLQATVKIIKETEATTRDSLLPSMLPAHYRTISVQDILISISDTIRCIPLISGIEKSGESKWEYIPPPSKTSRWEKFIALKTGIVNISYNNFQSGSFIGYGKTLPRPGVGVEGRLKYLMSSHETSSSGLSFGLGVSYLPSAYSADKYESAVSRVDKDNDSYYHILDINNMLEKQRIIGINIPLMVNFEKMTSLSKGFYFEAGGILSYLIGNYQIRTLYSTSGYYPSLNWWPKDDPYLNFESDKLYSGKGKLDVSPLNLSGNFDAGLFFRVRSNLQLYTGLFYQKSLLHFSSNTTKSISSSESFTYQSVLSELGYVNMSFIGIKLTIKRIPVRENNYRTVNYLNYTTSK